MIRYLRKTVHQNNTLFGSPLQRLFKQTGTQIHVKASLTIFEIIVVSYEVPCAFVEDLSPAKEATIIILGG